MIEKSKEEILHELLTLQEDFENYKTNTEKNYLSKIKASQYSFETIFQTNPDSVTVTKIEDGTYIQVNNGFLNITGYNLKEVIGKTSIELNIWKNVEDRTQILFELKKNGKIHNFETQFRIKDGSIITGLVSGKTFEYNNELCLLLIVRDISDYKKLIDKSIFNELRFRAFFTNRESGVSLLDINGNIKSANEKFCNMLGYTLNEIKTKNYKDISYLGDIDKNQENLNNLYLGEINSFTIEKRFIRKDKTYYWGEIFVTGIRDKQGNLLETLGIQTDITYRKYESIRNRLKYELANITEKQIEKEDLYQNIANILGNIFYVRNQYLAVVEDDKLISFKFSNKKDIPYYEIEKPEEILISHIIKTKKSLTLNGNEIPEFLKDTTGEKHKLKVYSWQGAPIITNGKVSFVLVVRLFDQEINISNPQIELLEDSAKIISDLLDKRYALEQIKLFSQVLDQSPVIAIITDEKGNIEYVNKKAIDVMGYKAEELINKNPRIFKSNKQESEVYKELWDTILSGKTWIGDILNKKKNGELYWSRNIISPIKNSAGRIIHFVALNLDVTELKQAELESQKFNLLVNNSKDFIGFETMDGKFTFINNGGREMMGIPLDYDISKLKIEDLLSEQSIKILMEKEIPSVMKNGFWRGEYTNKHFKKGYEIPVLINSYLIRDPKTKKPIGMGTILHDLTEKNKAIKALKHSEDKFKTLADNSINMIYIFKDGKFLYVNKMFIKIFGYSEKEIMDPKFELLKKIVKPESLKTVQEVIEAHNNGKEIAPYEVKVITKDGTELELIDSSNLIEFNDQKAVMGIFTDITQRKVYEREIVTAKEKAEELSRLKSSFYANMSHELRTPLVGIIGASELIKEEINDPDLKIMADMVYTSGLRLTKTLNNILDLSKVNSDNMVLVIEEIDLVEIVNKRIDFYKSSAKNKDLDIIFNKKCDILNINLDNDKMIEVIDNLLSNSIKFTSDGYITISVDKQTIDEKSFAIISIKDTGIGISKKDINYIFDEYRQASEGLSRNYEGTGLGLTITKKYVEMMNGTIEVESKVNKGSNFIIKFPIN